MHHGQKQRLDLRHDEKGFGKQNQQTIGLKYYEKKLFNKMKLIEIIWYNIQ